ncbi:hypothetical protein JCM18549_27680 [Halolamina salina]
MFGAAVVPAPVSAADGPEGMVALGSGQISEDVPEGADLPIRASDLEGAVYASEHAGSLEVVLTTPERADEHLGPNASVVANDEVAIVLRDDEVHEGRDVAVGLDVLEKGVGFVPKVAYGTHESGEEWRSPIEREGTVGVFHVPEFSSNSVTFTGGIKLDGDAAGNGTQYQYELSSLDGVDDFSINVTGVTNSEWDNVSANTLSDGDTATLDISGNLDPTGPASGSPEVTFKPAEAPVYNPLNGEGDGNTDASRYVIGDDGTGNGIKAGIMIQPDQNVNVSELRPYIGATDGSGYSASVDIYISQGTPDSTWAEGTLVKSGWEPSWSSGRQSVPLDSNIELTAGTNYTVEFVTTNSDSDGANDHLQLAFDWDGSTSSTYTRSVGTTALDGYWADIQLVQNEVTDPGLDIDGDGSLEASYSGTLSGSESVTRTLSSLSVSNDTVTVSATSGAVDIEVDLKERTQTEDPGVIVNGYETTHDGVLDKNETISLATNEAWLREGTNNVTVTTNSSAGGPESLVGFEYSHDAAGTTKSVSVEATSWTESFNVSHTFPSAVADAESTLTFNEHVVEINAVEVRRNGGSWNETNDYTLNGTDLTVQLGDVAADSEIDIRATGYKVGVRNGAIDVLEPTVDGDKLDTKIEIENRSENFALDLSGMDRVHYAAEETWTGDSAYVTVDSGGDQLLHFADANEGSTARVRTIPLEVEPVDGEIAVHVENPEAPRFRFSDEGVAGSSSVDVTYHDTTAGNRYVLWSVTQSREIDADRAESPVQFSTGLTSAQTFEIRQRDRSDSVGGVVPQQQSPGSSAPLVLVVPAVGISVAGLFWAGRRFGGASGIRGNALLLVGSTIVAVAALELVSPGTISSIWRATVFALGDAAASGVGAVIAAIAVFFGLWQINARTSADVPWWVTIPTVGIASIMALEAIRPGSVLGALQGVLAEVGGLVVLIVLGIVAYVIYQRQKTQQAEASTPDTQVELDLGEGEN